MIISVISALANNLISWEVESQLHTTILTIVISDIHFLCFLLLFYIHNLKYCTWTIPTKSVHFRVNGLKWGNMQYRKYRGSFAKFNPSNAEATFIRSTRTSFLKIIETLPCWYPLESSRWVLSDEYPFARVSVIF